MQRSVPHQDAKEICLWIIDTDCLCGMEKAESKTGWLFPVDDEPAELGYKDMFLDMFDAMDASQEPMETFYDGYVVNAIMDACYRSAESRTWEPVLLDEWRGAADEEVAIPDVAGDEQYVRLKEERLPDGRVKQMLRDRQTGEIVERIVEAD